MQTFNGFLLKKTIAYNKYISLASMWWWKKKM